MSRHGEWLLTLDVADDILRSPSGLRSPQCCQCCHLQLAPGLHWRGSESDWARVESGVAAWCEVTLHPPPCSTTPTLWSTDHNTCSGPTFHFLKKIFIEKTTFLNRKYIQKHLSSGFIQLNKFAYISGMHPCLSFNWCFLQCCCQMSSLLNLPKILRI